MKSTKHTWKRYLSVLLVLCMVAAYLLPSGLVSAANAGATLWVDPVNGNDANAGTTEAAPLKTIQTAKTKAAALSADSDVVVYLKGGTYSAADTITFGEAESGKNGHTITYKSAVGETAIISGGTRLEGWTLHDAQKNIYVTDIPAGTELTRQFYVDGKPQPIAGTETSPTDWVLLSSNGYMSPYVDSADNTEYLILDLGSDKQVSSVTLYAGSDRASDNKAAGFPKDFTISTSADGKNWTVQVKETDYATPIAKEGIEFIFNTVGARYIKVEATKLGNPTKTNPDKYMLALSEIYVGLSGEKNTINLSLIQHLNIDNNLVKADKVMIGYYSDGDTRASFKDYPWGGHGAELLVDGDLSTYASCAGQWASWLYPAGSNTPAVLMDLGGVKAVGGVKLAVRQDEVCWPTSFEVQVSADGKTWTTVVTEEDYDWSECREYTNVFAFNPVPASKVRVLGHVVGQDGDYHIQFAEAAVYAPANLANGATVDAPNGTGADKLTDGSFDGGYVSDSAASSVAVSAPITVDLGSVQSIGGVRLYPVYDGNTVVDYMKAARISVSTDGENFTSVIEMTNIATPNGGAQLLLFPKAVNAQYVKIEVMQVTAGTASKFCLQLQELEIAPAKVEVEEDTEEPEITYEKVYTSIALSDVSPKLGHYANTDLTGGIISNDMAPGEAECIVDNNFNSEGFTKYYKYSDLVQFGGDIVPAFYMELPGGVEFGALDLTTSKKAQCLPLDFEIQVNVSESGEEWVTIVKEEDANWVDEATKTFEFDAVKGYALRVLAYEVSPEVNYEYTLEDIAEDPESHSTMFCLREIDLYSVKEVPVVEEDKTPDSETTVYEKLPLDGDSILGFGHYISPDLDEMNTVWIIDDGENAIDGNYNNRSETRAQQYNWLQDYGGGNAPALVLDVTQNGEAAKINAIELTVREDGRCAPYHFVIQVTTEAGKDNWTTVVDVAEAEWSRDNTALYKVGEMEIYKLRLVCFNLTPATNMSWDEVGGQILTYLHINELALFNIYDPTNPIPETVTTQGDNASDSVNYKVMGITAKNENSDNKYSANKAVDGLIDPDTNNGWLVPESYNLDQLTTPETVEIHTLYLWYHNIIKATGVSGDGTELYASTSGLMPTWVTNAYIFINCVGEWYIDREEGKIYYMADGTMEGKEAILPVTEQVISMDGATNIIFDGISFQHTSWTRPSEIGYNDQQANTYYYGNAWNQVPAGILVESSQNITFTNCEITNMGTAGIKLKSVTEDNLTDGVKITNCLIHDISYSGIIVGEVYAHHGYKTDYLVTNTTIQNCYITRVGLDMFDSPGIVACYTNGTIIDHNEIAYCPYSGISTGWGWDADNDSQVEQCGNIQVTNNLVHDTGKTNRDGGSIYNLNASQGSVISGNYIYNSWDGDDTFENGLYLDQGSAYIEVYNNVVGSNVGYWMHMWTSTIHDNNWHNNYYVNGTKWRNDGPNNTVKDNTGVDDGDFSGYPEALAIMENAGLLDESVKGDIAIGFASQHDIVQEFYPGNKSRYMEPDWGWKNVTIDSQVSKTTYDSINKTVSIIVSPNADLTKLALRFELEEGWTSDKASGSVQDFTNPVTYTLTNGSQTVVWTVTAKLKVITEGEITGEEIEMGDIIGDYDAGDWTVPPVRVNNGNMYFNEYSGYIGQIFGTDTIFKFDMSAHLDQGSKDWVAISLRNQDPNTSCLNGNTEYNISFSYNYVEIQKFIGGDRTILYGENTGFSSVYGTMPNNFFDGDVRHSIKIGAINVEEGVRLFMYVDGNKVFDFVDTENPITEGGYFAVYPETQMIMLGSFTDIQKTPDTTDLDKALAIAESLVASDYTEETYAAVINALAQAQAILETVGGCTQEMVDEAYELLNTALSALVRTDGSTGPIIKPGGPGDSGDSGKTGDDTLLIGFIVMLAVSVVAIAVVLIVNKRRNMQNQQ